jgi:hypothetical protein
MVQSADNELANRIAQLPPHLQLTEAHSSHGSPGSSISGGTFQLSFFIIEC